MKAKGLNALRKLLFTPLMMLAGLIYGAVAGCLLGIGMAILLWDKKLNMPVSWAPLAAVARAGFATAAFAGWLAAGTVVGALLPIFDRGTFAGIMRYGLPVKFHRRRTSKGG